MKQILIMFAVLMFVGCGTHELIICDYESKECYEVKDVIRAND